ncbi:MULTISPECIES: hypothetical protein [unclassified Tolypothrix]|uniref:hypothetical protein n=1 Tax=unclassified Tolypothrix TaxID=2649714 RepID=UPI0005EAA20D|nr:MULTISPECIES: hypothetical protein [unclassified Tolypothrix]BAY88968.1 hypothetical protein NIES3275_09700 [Microchaete diplosiphon NIES-3275]EKF06110.1 hypothetical protein FDUTEX481_00046 [Tolypothrix sp. PCC 7601]MBE9080739.1 hypothetical protein [Tolypothrix sp. LEGE 11397]UYD29606.1 hypothetical protein HGR01_17225 [Tolypothrix sp. PCC 7712]UYD34478.1 hypothetical protein HG267_01055 [Tolypothrix sp. PCC 7601]
MKSSLVPIQNLHLSDRIAMYALLDNHFKGVTWDGFQADLERKNWVLLLRDDITHTLKGFSTLMLSQTTFAGEQISVIYSGDTIVDPSAWSSTTLPRSWINAVNFLRQHYVENKLYWLLICSGFRTYRFLPTFWQEFYPRHNIITPTHITNLMGSLGQQYYGDSYQQASGIVRFQNPQILRENLIEIPIGRQTNPHIQFFEQKNPDYRQGDELVCLTEISYDNLTRAGQRMWHSEALLEFIQDSVLI